MKGRAGLAAADMGLVDELPSKVTTSTPSWPACLHCLEQLHRRLPLAALLAGIDKGREDVAIGLQCGSAGVGASGACVLGLLLMREGKNQRGALVGFGERVAWQVRRRTAPTSQVCGQAHVC